MSFATIPYLMQHKNQYNQTKTSFDFDQNVLLKFTPHALITELITIRPRTQFVLMYFRFVHVFISLVLMSKDKYHITYT